jgi:hypothetical protein
MNHINAITTHSQHLPEHLQQQVLDFICYLESRYSFATPTKINSDTPDADIEQACGILTASHGVTLEQMDAAIKKRGGSL